jgi:hypothetical protein
VRPLQTPPLSRVGVESVKFKSPIYSKI